MAATGCTALAVGAYCSAATGAGTAGVGVAVCVGAGVVYTGIGVVFIAAAAIDSCMQKDCGSCITGIFVTLTGAKVIEDAQSGRAVANHRGEDLAGRQGRRRLEQPLLLGRVMRE
ncbi:hypothetical protein [Streptomyces sp. NPDC047043]|uniref:hypothetical protein n=1 Tax=Streptomyces sp. NPDC047043 TaxID=3154497 RepID=UPI0033D27DFE